MPMMKTFLSSERLLIFVFYGTFVAIWSEKRISSQVHWMIMNRYKDFEIGRTFLFHIMYLLDLRALIAFPFKTSFVILFA